MTGYRPPCTRPRCTDGRYALDLCERHYNQERRRRIAAGDADKIPTEQARKHIQLLRWRGWPWTSIAPTGRTSEMMLKRILAGGQPTMRRDKVTRILAIEPVWQRTLVPVPMVGTRRRLDALAWQGWPNRVVAAHIGLCEWTIPNTYRTQRITAHAAAKVADFYDTHAHQPGPNPAYAKKARTQGALPAAVWDDATIDDPDTQPAGIRTSDEAGPVDLAEVDHLLSFGYSLDTVAAQLGVQPASIESARWRANRRQVAAA